MSTDKRRKDFYELIGLAAIVASLVFVALEIRQNTNAVRSSVIQSITDQSIGAIAMVVENAELRASQNAVRAGDATDDQKQQVNLFYAILLRVQTNRFLQSKIEAIDKKMVLTTAVNSTVYDTSAFREYWNSVKNNLDGDFQYYMENDVFSDTVVEPEFSAR